MEGMRVIWGTFSPGLCNVEKYGVFFFAVGFYSDNMWRRIRIFISYMCGRPMLALPSYGYNI